MAQQDAVKIKIRLNDKDFKKEMKSIEKDVDRLSKKLLSLKVSVEVVEENKKWYEFWK